ALAYLEFGVSTSLCVLHLPAFVFLSSTRYPPRPALFPYTTLFRSGDVLAAGTWPVLDYATGGWIGGMQESTRILLGITDAETQRSEEHTSELQSRENLVCRLQLEKKTK